MNKLFFFVIGWVLLLAGCGGGGNSSVTTITGGCLNAQSVCPAVSLATPFSQVDNNLLVVVDAGPSAFSLPNPNILYTSVTVCEPGTSNCQNIDHVMIDTGSVGLRILPSAVSQLTLQSPPVGNDPLMECYQFVVGGLWGATVVADVQLGRQVATAVPIQLIQEGANPNSQAWLDCANGANGGLLTTSAGIGANGILGIGSTTLDCGGECITGQYTGTVPYYTCATAAVQAQSQNDCTATAVPANMQVFNPVAAIHDPRYNNGVVISLPAVPNALGAATATGELVLGVDTVANNQTGSAQKVYLGIDPAGHSYLDITTQYGGYAPVTSYLDTGTNTMVFTDSRIAQCLDGAGQSTGWYCPVNPVNFTALLSDGDVPGQNATSVSYTVANTEAQLTTANMAMPALARPIPPPTAANPTPQQYFAWGLPFFYGRRVSMTIWDLSSVNGPWYAWTPI